MESTLIIRRTQQRRPHRHNRLLLNLPLMTWMKITTLNSTSFLNFVSFVHSVYKGGDRLTLKSPIGVPMSAVNYLSPSIDSFLVVPLLLSLFGVLPSAVRQYFSDCLFCRLHQSVRAAVLSGGGG